jgi:CDP-glucose 4,6-dehydratase
MISPAFWRDARVLVTGHTGFKGAWLWQLLEHLGARPFGIGLAPDTEPNLSALTGIDVSETSWIVDIRDVAATTAALADIRPDIVMHLAADPIVLRSYDRPVETFATNVLGTVNLLEAVRCAGGVRAIVIVTSDKCYLNNEWPWTYRETDPLGGHDPYSASKACVELVAAMWRRAFLRDGSPALATVRAGNVIGGGDWAPYRLIPDSARAFVAGRSVEIRNPASVRPWQHVLDPLTGYLMVAERLVTAPAEAAEAWNFAPDDVHSLSVAQVIAAFARHWGGDARWEIAGGAQHHEDRLLRLDASKARGRLGWRPRLDLDTAIAWSADWYRRCAAGESARALCDEQIRRHRALATDGRASASAARETV